MNEGERKYWIAAFGLGVVWFLVLLIPLATREVLLPQGTKGPWAVTVRVFLVCVASVVLARVFKRLIIRRRSVWVNAVLSLLLPLVGTEIFVLVEFLTMLHPINLARMGWAGMLEMLLARLTLSVPIVIHYAFYVMVPMGFISQYVMSTAGRTDRNPPGWVFGVLTSSSVVLGLACMAWFKQLDGTRIVTYEMNWSYGPPAAQCGGTRHILLRFVSFPSDSIGICSQNLATYLESLPSNKVPVTFEVTYDLRSVRVFHEVRSYYQTQGQRDRSPWDP